MRLSLLALVAASALAAAAAAAAHEAASCGPPGAGSQTATTPSYTLTLGLGAPERMWTPAQVRTLHPRIGELMLGGTMAMGDMSMGGKGVTRHLEVHVCSRATGTVLANVRPVITLSDRMGMEMRVGAVKMRGVTAGPDDVHYGDDVRLAPGDAVTVKVAVGGESATFRVELPQGRPPAAAR